MSRLYLSNKEMDGSFVYYEEQKTILFVKIFISEKKMKKKPPILYTQYTIQNNVVNYFTPLRMKKILHTLPHYLFFFCV